jgi:acyl carrier protein
LPTAAVPSRIVCLDALPRTPSGKVDKRALPAPPADRPRPPLVAPETQAERELAAIWAEVLRVPEVGLDDDFFELGGHSLVAIQAQALVRERLGVELPLQAAFTTPTVRQLAGAIDAALLGGADHDRLAALLAEVEGPGGEFE